jgi:hypothetical protein
MSNVNIQRAVENIRSGTNVYTPLVEVIVNAIEAIEASRDESGRVEVRIARSLQRELDAGLAEVIGFTISDDGIGFNEANRESFDTLYTTHKLPEGGKGFGRFICLKYFNDVRIESVFKYGDTYRFRNFRMGRETELIVNEEVGQSSETRSGSSVHLRRLRSAFPDKGMTTIARTLVEKLLPYFIAEDRECPTVVLVEADGSGSIELNTYLGGADALIVEEKSARGEFVLGVNERSHAFIARVFKLYSPKVKRSRVSLVAHRREVVPMSLYQYIPEFSEEFYDEIIIDGVPTQRNFVVAVYVFGDYLDDHVSVERAGFEFQKDTDLLYGISQREIEAAAAEYGRQAVAGEVRHRQERKVERIKEYIRHKAPWHNTTVREADLSDVPYGASEDEIEVHLHRLKHTREVKTRRDVAELLASEEEDLEAKVAQIVREVSESSRSELVHYVALRKSVLEIFKRALELKDDGRFHGEHVVHDVIFPRKGDSDTTPFEDHNLWIIDERLNFTEYLSSDRPLDDGKANRPDLIAFDRGLGFRGSNEASNPVTIFEFKKPERDDFVDPSSKEDPIQQIVRYVLQIKEGKYRTRRGREIHVADNTPFYGYVICDLTSKVRRWVENEKDFRPMPDRKGYFRWHDNLNLYLEVLGWDKILDDAVLRNRIFFHKLGID